MAGKEAEKKFWDVMEKYAVDDDCLGYLLNALTDEELIRATEKIQKEEEAAEKEQNENPGLPLRVGIVRSADEIFKRWGGTNG